MTSGADRRPFRSGQIRLISAYILVAEIGPVPYLSRIPTALPAPWRFPQRRPMELPRSRSRVWAVRIRRYEHRVGDPFIVSVEEPATTHELLAQRLRDWLDGAAKSPEERVLKDRLKQLVGD